MIDTKELKERSSLEAIIYAQEIAESHQISICFSIRFCVRIAMYWEPQDSNTISCVDKSINLLPW